jgi:UDP-N-acetylglucosamine 2-epimerase (non-hydrolysing)
MSPRQAKRKRFLVSVIAGTRPEAIKLAPVIAALRADDRFKCHFCATGQHREMLDQVLKVFRIRPDSDLDLMRPNQSLAGLTARALEGVEKHLLATKPDLVLVQGDTTTVLSAALSAFYNHIPVGHVEAGLRTGDMRSPWPEEANRTLTTRLADLHFAPTERNRDNLLREGVPPGRIFVTGNTVIDALRLTVKALKGRMPDIPGLPRLALRGGAPVVLISGHRRENFGPRLESICRSIADLAERFPGTQFIYPVHLNPNVRVPVARILSGKRPNIHLLAPLPYPSFVALMERAALLLSDSGGVQEEAPFLGKPVLVMRDETERPEAVAAGSVRLVGAGREKIVRETSRLLTDRAAYRRMARRRDTFGDGRAAQRVVDACARFLQERRG